MIYRDFKGKQLSLLGFGAMRLPLLEDKSIDEAQTAQMIDYALEHGVNYFDTAWPYMENLSETIVGKCLAKHPRDSFYLATKFPGHMIAETYDPEDIFEKQLKKCQVDYFDFYLLHNIYENSIDVYRDPRWGIVDYFVEQRKNGRIKHLGFSTHADVPCLTEFLNEYGDEMEFCQIQLNYLDWTMQYGKEKCELLRAHGLPIWVMEPLRGGKLTEVSTASTAYRWFQDFDDVAVVLSGMSSMEQMIDNVATFENEWPLSDEEAKALNDIAEDLKSSIPCTACRYCCDGCPIGLDIPDLLNKYNQTKLGSGNIVGMQLEAFPEDKLPAACIGCGACAKVCPQKIDIPSELAAFDKKMAEIPSWSEICKKRDEAARRAEAIE